MLQLIACMANILYDPGISPSSEQTSASLGMCIWNPFPQEVCMANGGLAEYGLKSSMRVQWRGQYHQHQSIYSFMKYVLMITWDVCFITWFGPILPQAVIYVFAIEASRQPEAFSATVISEKNIKRVCQKHLLVSWLDASAECVTACLWKRGVWLIATASSLDWHLTDLVIRTCNASGEVWKFE